MMNDDILEYGIVKESINGSATVLLSENESCSECTAKIFCRTDDNKQRVLIVKDDIGVSAGSHVLISVSSSQLLKMSFLLYGIPLLLFMTAIIGGTFLFDQDSEIYSALLAVGSLAAWYFIFSSSEKKKSRTFSRIVSKIND
jgi:sigma-E factor negative regulatory protein RseC